MSYDIQLTSFENINSKEDESAIEENVTVNIIGSCVSREIFNIKKGKKYDVQAYIHRNSLFTMFFDTPPTYRINPSEVPGEFSNFVKRMFCTTVNADSPEQLLARKGEWIILDTYYSLQPCAIVEYSDGKNRLLQYDLYYDSSLKEMLHSNRKFKDCKITPVDASINMTYYIDEVIEFLNKHWGNNIILINLPLAFIELNKNGNIRQDAPAFSNWEQQSNKMAELLVNRTNCQYIKMPPAAIRDYWRNSDHINVHYISEMYDYLKETVDAIIETGSLNNCVQNRLIAKYDVIIGNILLGEWASEKNILERVNSLIGGENKIDVKSVVVDCKNLIDRKNPLGFGLLSKLYRDGKGVEKDIDKAIELMRMAADGKIEWARRELFNLLWKRENLDDFREMKHIAEMAAEEENPDFLLRLGWMYRDGKGVDKDLDIAVGLIKRAKIKNPWFTNDYVDVLNRRGRDDDYAEAFLIASDYAAKGNKGAVIRLGRMYRDGKGVEKNIDLAIEYIRKIANEKIGWSRNELIDVLLARGKIEDITEAFDVAFEFASEGNDSAMIRLGRMYRDGKGVEKDLDKAIEWMRKATKDGNKWIIIEFFNTLWIQNKVEYDEEAVSMLIPLSEKKDVDALERLSWAYFYGRGVDKDLDVAIKFMREATIQSPRLNEELQKMLNLVSTGTI